MSAQEKIAPQVLQLIESRLEELDAHRDEILRLAHPLLRLESVEVEDYTNTGNCRFGGTPDLPAHIDYPVKDGRYYRFIGQINFAELPDSLGFLPESGILYLFCGDPYEDIFHNIFYDGTATLENKMPPEGMECLDPYQEEGGFEAQKAVFGLSYEIAWSEELEDLGLHYEPADRPYETHMGGTPFGADNEGVYLVLAGFKTLRYTVLFLTEPDQETYWTPQREALLKDMDDKIADPEKYSDNYTRINVEGMKEHRRQFLAFDENREQHRQRVGDVFCLLSLESLDACHMQWSDSGFINYYVLKEDLRRRDFTNLHVEVASP